MTEEHISNPKFGLPLGTKAPLINSNDVFEQSINLEDILRDHHGMILDFFRGAWWHYWKKQLSKFNDIVSELEKRNVKLITIATDRAKPLKRLAEKENYKFTVIADPEAKISNAYKVFGKPIDYEMIKNELAIPSTFLINPKGEIVWRYIGTKTDRPKMETIIGAIEEKLWINSTKMDDPSIKKRDVRGQPCPGL